MSRHSTHRYRGKAESSCRLVEVSHERCLAMDFLDQRCVAEQEGAEAGAKAILTAARACKVVVSKVGTCISLGRISSMNSVQPKMIPSAPRLTSPAMTSCMRRFA